MAKLKRTPTRFSGFYFHDFRWNCLDFGVLFHPFSLIRDFLIYNYNVGCANREGSELVYHRIPWKEPDAPYLLDVLYEDNHLVSILGAYTIWFC